MSDLRELYQQVILDHYKKPRNFRIIEGAKATEGFNPLCGDHYTVYVTVDGDKISDVAFQGSGCAISKASASVMSTLAKGMTPEEFDALFVKFRAIVTGETDNSNPDELDRLAPFAGVRDHPSRVKCATLAWHSVASAVKGAAAVVTTEDNV